jgi:hypothetical protein
MFHAHTHLALRPSLRWPSVRTGSPPCVCTRTAIPALVSHRLVHLAPFGDRLDIRVLVSGQKQLLVGCSKEAIETPESECRATEREASATYVLHDRIQSSPILELLQELVIRPQLPPLDALHPEFVRGSNNPLFPSLDRLTFVLDVPRSEDILEIREILIGA